jgi:hypothetical protein
VERSSALVNLLFAHLMVTACASRFMVTLLSACRHLARASPASPDGEGPNRAIHQRLVTETRDARYSRVSELFFWPRKRQRYIGGTDMQVTLREWQLNSIFPEQLEESEIQVRLENKGRVSAAGSPHTKREI